MTPNRTGKATEYKQGKHYLTITEWDDGHCEIEVHKCEPELLFNTCDPKELPLAISEFNRQYAHDRPEVPLIEIVRR